MNIILKISLLILIFSLYSCSSPQPAENKQKVIKISTHQKLTLINLNETIPDQLFKDDWFHREDMSFAEGQWNVRLNFSKESLIKKTEDRYDKWRHERRTDIQKFELKVWQSIMLYGSYYRTYLLDEKSNSLLIDVLVEINENQFYYVRKDNEIVFTFEDNPLINRKGRVLIKSSKFKSELTLPYTTSINDNGKYCQIEIKGDENTSYKIHQHTSKSDFTYYSLYNIPAQIFKAIPKAKR